MAEAHLSLLFLHWKRSENLTAILDVEAKYSSVAEIIVLNNNSKTLFQHAHPKVKVLNSSFDFGLRTRWVLGVLASNDCLVFQDDDLIVPEETLLAFHTELENDPLRAYSLHGRNPGKRNDYNSKDVVGDAEIVLTRATCIHKQHIPLIIESEQEFFRGRGTQLPAGREFPAEDIFLSYAISSHFGKKHKVLKLPHKNLSTPHAISSNKGHLRRRTELMRECQEFFGRPSAVAFGGLTNCLMSDAPKGDPSPSKSAGSTAPRKIRLVSRLSPGDVLMLTVAVRDLQLGHHGKFQVAVDTSVPELWENNPYLTKLQKDDLGVEEIEAHYPIIHESNEGAYHFIHGYRLFLEEKLGVKIKATKLWGDIHFRPEETHWISMVHEHFTGWDTPFWLICTGGKTDYTTKWWIPEYAQEVVDHFKDRIQFVQFGSAGENHHHPPLQGVINLVGRTSLRQFMRLMYHAQGVVCPITFAMHLAAATPAKPGFPKRKACVVTAGGREPSGWESYTHHVFLHANGQLPCCDNGGCWKNRVIPLNDGKDLDKSLCVNSVDFNGRKIQRCMRDLVTAKDAIRAIERYYIGGALHYLPSSYKTIHAGWEDRFTKSKTQVPPAGGNGNPQTERP